MLDNFIYENHLGVRFVGLENGVYLNHSELRDYVWDYEVINNRITRISRPVMNRALPLLVVRKTPEEAAAVRNRLLEVMEVDTIAAIPGKVIVGEYYTTGFITESTKSEYLYSRRHSRLDLVLTSADPAWSRETTHVFTGKTDGAASDRSGHDFPFDYPYDYSVTSTSKQISCESIAGSKFKIKVYGPAVDPAININAHVYKVNGTINAGESLLIDSRDKTIMLTTASGTKVNWFAKRSRESYIFEPIQPGMANVMYSGAFKFDLMVIEERSEPKWT